MSACPSQDSVSCYGRCRSPSMTLFLHVAEKSLQGAGTCLCKLEANCVVMTRPFPSWPSTRVTRASRTVVSLSVRPGDSTFVESLMNSATPSLPAAGTPCAYSPHRE